ncbi:SusD/RagB family nutrient-binding outer membrane lipoprotein [Olivibacter sp. XZL3]|uniref:SusD/RagB family nutrient-binding outer membrane lipoprotein n=1 Tax=Olivibacter sp. XZL3 TaxID=1735116 RepID=UPI0010648544|nr:SusD/RagB family nutrient-binding outer membrane lipoprotein [Olivibacter sp. XZL3]
MKKKFRFNIKGLLALAVIASLGLNGCKDFLDVNENPNNPDTAEPSLLLPTVEASIGQVVGNAFQVYGGMWAQYWTQNPSSSQYRAIDQYNQTNSATDRVWLTIYRNALNNAQIMINNQESSNDHFRGIAYLLKAYTFQVATDAFGDIPLSEALRGNEYGSPRYESQQTVYDSIFMYIDQGQALLAVGNAAAPGSQDMIFQGDISKWQAFGNTLKLKAYLRLSQVDAEKARAGIEALYASNPTFLEEDASIAYSTTGGNENPLYNEMVNLGYTQNLVASGTAVTAFVRNGDARRFAFYSPLSGQDTIAYIPQGSYSSNSGKQVSPPSALVGGHANNPASATAPVKVISAAESYFLQAEAVARGWASGDTRALFEQGIRESFSAVNLAGEADTYIANGADAQLPADMEGQIKAIITQKYFAMCGFQGFEAWTEWRRTGYPSFLVRSAASVIGGDRMPLRLIYPSNEVNTNGNFPGTVVVYEPVWWDK